MTLIAFGVKTTPERRDAFKAICQKTGKTADQLLEVLLNLYNGSPTPAGSPTIDPAAQEAKERADQLALDLGAANVELFQLRKENQQLQEQLENRPTGTVISPPAYVFDPGNQKDKIQRSIAWLIRKGKMDRAPHPVMLQQFTERAVGYFIKNAIDL